MHDHFLVSRSEVRREIGGEFQNFMKLVKWLFGEDAKLSYRIRPSICTRSEAELVGVSSPRFAIRAYVNGQDSFFNLRRIKRLAEMTAQAESQLPIRALHWVKEQPNRYLSREQTAPKPLNKKELFEFVSKEKCIADSILVPPRSRFPRGEFIGCELGLAYGEGKKIFGVPYVQHLGLGGGLCAQAACFMTAAILSQYANSLPTLAQISKLATASSYTNEPENSNHSELVLDGLDVEEIVRAMRSDSVGLWADRQIPRQGNKSFDIVAGAMRAYLRAGVPLIIPVDLGRMGGDLPSTESDDCIFTSNEIKPFTNEEIEKWTRVQTHVVVVVGFTKDSDTFYINCPATYPFLKATVAQLWMARAYTKGEYKGPEAELQNFEFIAITHPRVKWCLLDNGKTEGVINVARSLQIGTEHPTFKGKVDRKLRGKYRHGMFHLVQVDDAVATLDVDGFQNESELAKMISHAASMRKVAWLWVQVWDRPIVGDSIPSVWVWNAECYNVPEHDSREALNARLVGYYERHDGQWLSLLHDSESKRSDEDEFKESENKWPEKTVNHNLKKYVMTSFYVGGFSSSPCPPLPSGFKYDLYALMESECAHWCRLWSKAGRRRWKGRDNDRPSAVEFLARINAAETKELANAISKRFGKSNIGAISAFLPEIGYRPRFGRAKKGVKALCTLLRLAHELEKTNNLISLELTTGSEIRGIRHRKSDNKFVLVTNTTEKSHSYLCTNLKIAIKRTRHVRTKIALELEPGNFFLLRDLDTLKSLTAKLAENKTLSDRVYLNLDISHWRLAKIPPTEVKGQIAERIIHSHISGHHRSAHFGDIPPFALNSKEEFQPWLNLLSNLKGGNSVYQGGISLELEAVRDQDVLDEAIEQFRKM